ncbi:hypothetical protein U9M48_031047 [Paspalum notatum var. saurae]|uniref:Uncharacterized protein n=1 Tax=Paspalum notatum var. saurae TaxID=547442 RepID=A0AAQ3U6K7_PASNO
MWRLPVGGEPLRVGVEARRSAPEPLCVGPKRRRPPRPCRASPSPATGGGVGSLAPGSAGVAASRWRGRPGPHGAPGRLTTLPRQPSPAMADAWPGGAPGAKSRWRGVVSLEGEPLPPAPGDVGTVSSSSTPCAYSGVVRERRLCLLGRPLRFLSLALPACEGPAAAPTPVPVAAWCGRRPWRPARARGHAGAESRHAAADGAGG